MICTLKEQSYTEIKQVAQEEKGRCVGGALKEKYRKMG